MGVVLMGRYSPAGGKDAIKIRDFDLQCWTRLCELNGELPQLSVNSISS